MNYCFYIRVGRKNAFESSPVDLFKGFPIISEIVQCCCLSNFITLWNFFFFIIIVSLALFSFFFFNQGMISL